MQDSFRGKGVGVHDDGFVVPSGTVTFLFTNVEGSTRLWDADANGMSASLRVHDDIVRSRIESRDGYVFRTACDSFAAAFALASKAVEATTELQAALRETEWPGPELRVRAGLHLGEAEQRGGDYFGPAVNTASRVSASGHGGQTLLTEVVRAASRVKGTLDLGLHVLRDVEESTRIHQLGPGNFPDLGGSTGAHVATARADLPHSSFIAMQPGLPRETITLTTELTIGRDVGHPVVDGHLALQGDPTVSSLHAVFISKPTGWCVQATDAPNGLFVNGTRITPGAVHPLAPEDMIRLGERTTLVFHTLASQADDRSGTQADSPIPKLTPGERRVLLSLCSPLLCGDTFTPPATVHAIAMGLVVSESAVKQQLSRLYAKFEVHEGPDRRLRLANEALRCGAVHVADLESLGET